MNERVNERRNEWINHANEVNYEWINKWNETSGDFCAQKCKNSRWTSCGWWDGSDDTVLQIQIWNEWGFMLLLCLYRLNWARRASRWWWDEWDDTALQTQDSKSEPWRSVAEHAASRSQRLSTILNLYEWAGKKQFVSLKLEGQSGVRTRDLRLPKQAALTTALSPPPPPLQIQGSKFVTHPSTTAPDYIWLFIFITTLSTIFWTR